VWLPRTPVRCNPQLTGFNLALPQVIAGRATGGNRTVCDAAQAVTSSGEQALAMSSGRVTPAVDPCRMKYALPRDSTLMGMPSQSCCEVAVATSCNAG